MMLLLFLFVSLTVFCSTLVGCGALATTLRAYDGPLVQISSFLSPPTAEADDINLGHSLRHHHMARSLLQQQQEECGPNFVPKSLVYLNTVLGPASSSDSLFQNVKFPNNETLQMTRLGFCLLFPTYVDPSEPTFVQEEQFLGRNGELTNALLQQHENLIDFWNTTRNPPILLFGVHSEPLKDHLSESVQACYNQNGYGSELLTEDGLNQVVENVRTAIEEELPGNYSNPALSFEYSYYFQFGVAGFEDSFAVTIGDGVLDYTTSLGFPPEVGGSLLHAGVFSFVVQFALDLEENNGNLTAYQESMADNTPEDTRRAELEAVAMMGYALAHDQGGNWSFDMLLQAGDFAYINGDCSVDKVGHSGTPSQNECAALWGADEGLHAKRDPVSVREFRKLFQENLELIIALDPSVCTLRDTSDPVTSTSGHESRTRTITSFVLVVLSFLLL